MQRKYWLGGTQDEQKTTVQGVAAKLPQHAAALELTNQEVTDVQLLCAEFIAVQNDVYNCAQTMKAMTEWRDAMIYGDFNEKDATTPPQFLQVPTPTVKSGIVAQLKMFRDACMAKPGFNTDIGEDIGFLGAEISPRPPSQVTPVLKVAPAQNFSVKIMGSLQGFGAMRVEYARNGSDFVDVGFLTNTPNSVHITPAEPGKPEKGRIRAVFVKNSTDYGNFSSEYPVTIS